MTAIEILQAERARQHADALAAYRAAGPMAEQIAISVTETGRLLLLGMGASQHANRMAEAGLSLRPRSRQSGLGWPLMLRP